MTPRYPFLDLKAVTAPLQDRITQAVSRVIASGRYVGGEECEALEARLSALTGGMHAVGVSNGLDALRLIFRAWKETGVMQDGDQVIVPANTYIASLLAVTDNSLVPVGVDAHPVTMNLDWTKVEAAVTPRTRAVMAVHLYGRPTWDNDVVRRLRRRGIMIVEDNAQAIGANHDGVPTGALGNAAAFSFYPTKNIGALGDAGAVTTPHGELARTVRALANYGSDRRYHNIYPGLNCRLDPIQAAVLNVKLDHLADETLRRRTLAAAYGRTLGNPAITAPGTHPGHVWHQYVVRCHDRAGLCRHLDSNGVGWDIHYAVPPHRQPCYSSTPYAHTTDVPVTEVLANTVLSLPMSPLTTPRDAADIAHIINRWCP